MLTDVDGIREVFANPMIVPTAPIMLRFNDSDIEIPLDILSAKFGKHGEVVLTLNTTPDDLKARLKEQNERDPIP